jgi:hypothetical protein
MISKPQLPAKAGYVEIEVNGMRQYKKIPTENADITQMEDALCDMDASQEERLSAIEEALCELDELLNGGAEDA